MLSFSDPTGPVPAEEPVESGRLRLEGPGHRLLQDWKLAHVRAVAYLGALGIAEDERDALAREAVTRAVSEPWDEGSDAIDVTLSQLRTLLLQRHPAPPRPWDGSLDAFLAWRLATGVVARPDAPLRTAPVRDGHFDSMPPLCRTSMAPEPMERRLLRRWFGRLRGGTTAGARREFRRRRRALAWTRVAFRRRLLLATLVLLPTIIASGFMVNVLPRGGSSTLEFVIVVVFGVLFGWISIGFWAALMGFYCLVRGDRFAITRAPGTAPQGEAVSPPTAIVMPICNEPVERVFAGLRAIEESLAKVGAAERFHFFVLSDTTALATIVREEEAWAEWARDVDGFDRIFYRRRRVRLRRKSGNVADFCRRWGKRYPFMVMLDADSVMQGATLVRHGRAHGDASGRRHHPDRPGRGVAALALRARAAVREPRLRADVLRRLALLAARRRPVLGPQRDRPDGAVHQALRAPASAGKAPARRRDPEPRLRRGGPDGSRRLDDLARVRSRGARTRRSRRRCSRR